MQAESSLAGALPLPPDPSGLVTLWHWNREKGEYGPDKYSIRRYQKREGTYLQRSKFEISSPNQARAVRDNIENWFPGEE